MLCGVRYVISRVVLATSVTMRHYPHHLLPVIFVRTIRMKVCDLSGWPKDCVLALSVGLLFTLVFYRVPNDQANYGLFQSCLFMSTM